MLTQSGGVLPSPARPFTLPAAASRLEWERLRRELLRRIIDREVRRQSSRSGVR